MMKTIYINVTNTIEEKFLTGIQRVVRNVTEYFIKNCDTFNIVLISENKAKKTYNIIDKNVYLDWLIGKCEKAKSITSKEISPKQFESGAIYLEIEAAWGKRKMPPAYLYPLLKKKKIKIATYIYDLIPIRYPQYCDVSLLQSFPAYIDVVTYYSDLILTDSQYVADDIQELLKKARRRFPEFCVAYPGCDFKKVSLDDSAINVDVKNIAKKGKYILMVSTIEPRKNHKVILDAYDEFLKDEELNIIFAGKLGWKIKEFSTRLFLHKDYEKKLFLLSGQNDETISYLYQNAWVVVFSSHIEGYGLPSVEPLIAGAPTLLSDIPVLHETAGSYADYFNQNNPHELATKIKRLLDDDDLYKNRKRKLQDYQPRTWNQCGNKILNACRELYEK